MAAQNPCCGIHLTTGEDAGAQADSRQSVEQPLGAGMGSEVGFNQTPNCFLGSRRERQSG